jgi:cell division protein FtsL
MRILNILVIVVLIMAASYVYKIKFDSTLQAERVAKLHNEIRKERNAIAALRAEWARLDAPGRIQGLAERHLNLQPQKATQFDTLDNLPERPPAVPMMPGDAMAAAPQSPETTGSIAARR